MKGIHLLLSKPDGKTQTCSSRFWGNPDLPPGYAYPEYTDSDGETWPYTFICQINLEDLARYEKTNPLPHKGMLLFFAKIDYYMGCDTDDFISGYISGADDVKVLYFPDCGDFEELEILDENSDPYNPQELQITFAEKTEKYADEHMLFAPPEHREWENWDPPFEDWPILLQVDSFSGEDFDLNFMDCGVLDFLISPDDLAKHNFDNVRAIVLST